MRRAYGDLRYPDPDRTFSYTQSRYELSHTVEQQRSGPSAWEASVRDRYSGPTHGRDNGWAERHRRSGNCGMPVQSSNSHPPGGPRAFVASSSSYDWPPETPKPASSRHPDNHAVSTCVPIADQRRQSKADPELPVAQNKERKLEFLLRTIEERLVSRQAAQMPTWERLDIDLLNQLIEEHQKVGTEGTMRIRTMRTAVAHYLVLLDCHEAQGNEPAPEDTLNTLRTGVKNIVFDLCEENARQVRMEGYRAILELSLKDFRLARNNCSVLVQLLQNDGDDDELELVREMLAKHLELTMSADIPELSLSDCLQIVINDFEPLQGRVLDFLSSTWGQRALETIFMDAGPHQSILAQYLLPLADRHESAKVAKDLLRKLKNISVDAEPSRTEEGYSGRKRRNSEDSKEERHVRGRGTVHASSDDLEYSQGARAPPGSTPLSHVGLSIRGASHAKCRSPTPSQGSFEHRTSKLRSSNSRSPKMETREGGGQRQSDLRPGTPLSHERGSGLFRRGWDNGHASHSRHNYADQEYRGYGSWTRRDR